MVYKISRLTRRFADRVVLDIPNLHLSAGRIHALLGPNGSGKTTLLNLLAFLDTPTSGTIMFQGQEPKGPETSLLAMRRKVVLVDQYPIFFSRSVLHNLEFGLKIRKIAKSARRHMIKQALEMVGMENFSKAAAHTLSGGENKRAALARGLVLRPDVLLCDEPFANVDTENQDLIFNILQKINKEHGITIIFSSHDRPRAELLAHETLYLANGLLSETKRVNVIDAVVDDTPGRYRLKLPGNEIVLNGPIIPDPGDQTACQVQLDPRKISLLPLTSHNRQTNGLRGTVLEVRQQGEEIKFLIDCATPLTVLLSTAEYCSNPPLVGQQVLMVVAEEGVRVYRHSPRTVSEP